MVEYGEFSAFHISVGNMDLRSIADHASLSYIFGQRTVPEISDVKNNKKLPILPLFRCNWYFLLVTGMLLNICKVNICQL